MKKLLLSAAVASLTLPVASTIAMETGPLFTGEQAGDWGVGAHYYYGRSQWETGHDLTDRMIGDVTQKGAYLTADYSIFPWLEAHAAIGGIGYETTSDFPGADTESSMDTMFSAALTARVIDTDSAAFGPFLRFTRYSDYELNGSVTNGGPSTDFELETARWRKFSAGLMAQHKTEPANIYYGIYHNTHSVDLEGTYGSDTVEMTAKEDRDVGLFIGAVWPVTKTLDLTMEFDRISDSAVAVGLNYRFAPTRVVTKTQVLTETVYVEREKLDGPAVEERTILFRAGSAEVEKGYWSELKAFADFLNTYKDTEAFIGGHSDCIGSEEANIELSQRRGDAVKEMLVALYGIDPDRITVLAMGESMPAVEPDETYGRKENRRAVLVGRAYSDY